MKQRPPRVWPPRVFTVFGVDAPSVEVARTKPAVRPPRPVWRCRWCGEVTAKAWAPTERHALECDARPAGAAGWVEVVLGGEG